VHHLYQQQGGAGIGLNSIHSNSVKP
jgi:hypothetical protein